MSDMQCYFFNVHVANDKVNKFCFGTTKFNIFFYLPDQVMTHAFKELKLPGKESDYTFNIKALNRI